LKLIEKALLAVGIFYNMRGFTTPTPIMKAPNSAKLALSLILLGVHTSSAQTIETPIIATHSAKAASLGETESSSFAANKHLSGIIQIPEVQKSQADLSEPVPVFMKQDPHTLSTTAGGKRRIENVVDLSVIRDVSVYRQADRAKIKVSDVQATGIKSGLAELSAAYREPGQTADSADCPSVVISVEQRVKLDPSAVLEIVDSEISANPDCACEIVKIAIQASGADVSLVGDIAEVAITSAPQSMRMISQCAIAAKPEALTAVQAILAKLDPNSGDGYSAKDAKSGKDAKDAIASEVSPPEEPPNPLDKATPFFPPTTPPYLPPPLVTDLSP
jgi:hypothetical protein